MTDLFEFPFGQYHDRTLKGHRKINMMDTKTAIKSDETAISAVKHFYHKQFAVY